MVGTKRWMHFFQRFSKVYLRLLGRNPGCLLPVKAGFFWTLEVKVFPWPINMGLESLICLSRKIVSDQRTVEDIPLINRILPISGILIFLALVIIIFDLARKKLADLFILLDLFCFSIFTFTVRLK